MIKKIKKKKTPEAGGCTIRDTGNTGDKRGTQDTVVTGPKVSRHEITEIKQKMGLAAHLKR